MTYRKFVEKNSKNTIFSEVDELGSFDFETCLISLEYLKLNDLENLKKYDVEDESSKDEAILALRKVLPLAIHEYTHFIDSTSTVWGINHLEMMVLAYESDHSRGGKEESFFMAKQFSDHLNKIKYPDYYTVVNDIDDPKPWIAQPTIGRLFGADGKQSEESILFLRFTRNDGELIVRSPISPASILEASAMAQEVFSDGEMIQSHSDNCKIIENHVFSRKILTFLYDKKITEYSACVHMLANQQRCSSVFQAFLLVSLITRVVLNSTVAVFNAIIERDCFYKTLNLSSDHEMLIGLRDGLRHNNIGILYYLIVSGLPEKSYLDINSAKKGVEKSLELLGTSIEFINDTASKHIEERVNEISKTKIDPIKEIADKSKKNWARIALQDIALPFDKLCLPKVMLGDETEAFIFPPDQNELKDFDIEECFNELASGASWVKRFSEGCV